MTAWDWTHDRQPAVFVARDTFCLTVVAIIFARAERSSA